MLHPAKPARRILKSPLRGVEAADVAKALTVVTALLFATGLVLVRAFRSVGTPPAIDRPSISEGQSKAGQVSEMTPRPLRPDSTYHGPAHVNPDSVGELSSEPEGPTTLPLR